MLRIGASAVVAVFGYLSAFLQWDVLEPARIAFMDMLFLSVIPLINVQVSFELLVAVTIAIFLYAIHKIRKIFIEDYTNFFEEIESESVSLEQA